MARSRAMNKVTRNDGHEIIEISDSESEHDTEVQKMKKLLDHRTAEMQKREEQLVQQLEKYQKENENMMAECASYKAEITKLQEALKLAKGDNHLKKELVKDESKVNIKVDLGPAVKTEKKEEEDSKVKIDPLVEPLLPKKMDPGLTDGVQAIVSVPEVSNDVLSRDPSVHRSPASPRAFPDDSYHDDYKEHIPVVSEDIKHDVPVIVKTEDQPDESKHVSFAKSEDGKLDIWNLDGFDLGPPIKVEECFHAGFSRKVISDALGGGHQECFHHWQKRDPTKIPYVTFKRSWNSQLPFTPGAHGVVFETFGKYGDGTPVREPIDFVVGEKANYWQYCGTYDIKRTGEIIPSHLNLLPPSLLTTWVKGLRGSPWGVNTIREFNQRIADKAEENGSNINLIDDSTDEGVRTALMDGRIVIGFSIMQCVGYRRDWYEKFVHYKAHPKLPKNRQKKRKSTSNAQGSPPAKKPKPRLGKKAVKSPVKQPEMSNLDSDDQIDSEDYDQLDTGN